MAAVQKDAAKPEFRLHVQVANHRKQQRRQNLLPLPVFGQLVHVVFRQHRRHRLQGQDRLPTR